jgi:nucleotide-binding universal stress UspA family protein
MKRILIPTDFSDNASNALEYAVEAAQALQSELLIMHVYTPPVSRQSAIHAIMAEEIGRATRKAQEQIETIVKTIKAEYPSLSCSGEVTVGETVSEILTLASDRKVDMIIMGTRGATKMSNVIFGSNTASIIEESACPVLCIPDNTTYKRPEKILYSTNFSYSDISSATLLTELARAFNARLLFAHIVVGTEETDEEKEVIDKFAEEIRKVTGYEKIEGVVISDANINTGLDALIEKTGVDIIALATRKRSLFEKIFNPSITKKFSYYTNTPLLAFHSGKEDDKD